MQVVYDCSCVAFGNADFTCPKHNSPIAHFKEYIQIDTCKKCHRKLQLGEEFVWKRAKNSKDIRVYHTKCLLKKLGWLSGIEGKYRIKKGKVNGNESDSNLWTRRIR